MVVTHFKVTTHPLCKKNVEFFFQILYFLQWNAFFIPCSDLFPYKLYSLKFYSRFRKIILILDANLRVA